MVMGSIQAGCREQLKQGQLKEAEGEVPLEVLHTFGLQFPEGTDGSGKTFPLREISRPQHY